MGILFPSPNSYGQRSMLSGCSVRLFIALIIAGVSLFSYWRMRSPNPMSGPSKIELRPFLEAVDLAEFLTPDELATPREGERGKLGVA